VANPYRITGIVQNRSQALSEPVLFVDLAQQKQSGIGGDMATGEVGFNLTAREWREGQFFRYHFGWRLLVLGKWCKVLKL